MVYKLCWSRPGSVWAADLSKPPRRVRVHGRVVLAVRDLASGYTVAWTPLPCGSAEAVGTAMERLFRRHAPPLVLKTDNGSCFRSALFQALLQKFQVTNLRSPRAWPQYNGACEAGIGALRETTDLVAAGRDEHFSWTLESLEEARERLNARPRPTSLWCSAKDLWNARRTLRGIRLDFQKDLGLTLARSARDFRAGAWGRARLIRKAVEATLQRFGCLRIGTEVVRARAKRPGPRSYR